MFPRTIPPTIADFALIFPRILAFSPMIIFPSVSRFPSISPSILTKPLILMFPVIAEPCPKIVLIEMSSIRKAIKTYFDKLILIYFAGSTTSEPI